MGIPSAITPIGQLHQSPPSPIPGDLGRGPSHQSLVLEHRDTYGQAQVCSKGRQGSSVDRLCQPSFWSIKFWHVRNPTSTALPHSSLGRPRIADSHPIPGIGQVSRLVRCNNGHRPKIGLIYVLSNLSKARITTWQY